MRSLTLSLAMVAVSSAGLFAAGTRAVRTVPVRLPAVETPALKALPTCWPATPGIVPPIALGGFESFEPAAAVELDLGPPHKSRTTVGGWIDVGYRGGVGQ